MSDLDRGSAALYSWELNFSNVRVVTRFYDDVIESWYRWPKWGNSERL